MPSLWFMNEFARKWVKAHWSKLLWMWVGCNKVFYFTNYTIGPFNSGDWILCQIILIKQGTLYLQRCGVSPLRNETFFKSFLFDVIHVMRWDLIGWRVLPPFIVTDILVLNCNLHSILGVIPQIHSQCAQDLKY